MSIIEELPSSASWSGRFDQSNDVVGRPPFQAVSSEEPRARSALVSGLNDVFRKVTHSRLVQYVAPEPFKKPPKVKQAAACSDLAVVSSARSHSIVSMAETAVKTPKEEKAARKQAEKEARDARKAQEQAQEIRKELDAQVVDAARKLVASIPEAYQKALKESGTLDRSAMIGRSIRKKIRVKSSGSDGAPAADVSAPVRAAATAVDKYINACEALGRQGGGIDYRQPLADLLGMGDDDVLEALYRDTGNDQLREQVIGATRAGMRGQERPVDAPVIEGPMRERQVLNALHEIAKEVLSFRFQERPMAALVRAGLFVDLDVETYEKQLPFVRDAIAGLYRGSISLAEEKNSRADYISDVIKQHVRPGFMPQLRTALAMASAPGGPVSQARTALLAKNVSEHAIAGCVGTLYVSMLRELRDVVEKEPLDDWVIRVWAAIAPRLRASEVPLRADNLEGELKKAFDLARREIRDDTDNHADQEESAALEIAIGEGATKESAIKGSMTKGSTALASTDWEVSLAGISTVCAIGERLTPSRLEVTRADAKAAESAAALDARRPPMERLLTSSFPYWADSGEAPADALVYARDGVLRRSGVAAWGWLKDTWASGERRQIRRLKSRQLRVKRDVAAVVHCLFARMDERGITKLDASVRRLLEGRRKLAKIDPRADRYMERCLPDALRHGDRSELEAAWNLLLDGRHPLVTERRRGWTARALDFLRRRLLRAGRDNDLQDKEVFEQAAAIRIMAGNALQTMVLHRSVMNTLRDLVASRGGPANGNPNPTATIATFKKLMTAYSVTGVGSDPAAWIMRAAELLPPEHLAFLEKDLANYSTRYGKRMMKFFKLDMPEVGPTMAPSEYCYYEYFAEALYKACSTVNGQNKRTEAPGLSSVDSDAGSDASDIGSNGSWSSRNSWSSKSLKSPPSNSRDGSPEPGNGVRTAALDLGADVAVRLASHAVSTAVRRR